MHLFYNFERYFTFQFVRNVCNFAYKSSYFAKIISTFRYLIHSLSNEQIKKIFEPSILLLWISIQAHIFGDLIKKTESR